MSIIRRLLIFSGCVVVAVAAAAPATAKKPRPPAPEPDLFSVEFHAGGAGFLDSTTGCTVGGALTMRDVDGNLAADDTLGTSVPTLELDIDVPWTRVYPSPIGDETGFSGCHGAYPDPDGPASAPSYLWIYRDGGHVTGMLWAFDTYVGTEIVQLNPRKSKTTTVKEYFRTWAGIGTSFETVGDTTTVSGDFTVTHYSPEGIVEIGSAPMTFTFTIIGPLG